MTRKDGRESCGRAWTHDGPKALVFVVLDNGLDDVVKAEEGTDTKEAVDGDENPYGPI